MKTAIGIDNGPTGTIGIITPNFNIFIETPIKKEQNYTKKKGNISRIDVIKLFDLFKDLENCFALLERPFVNSKMFNATLSSVRALEATLNVIELLKIPYQYIDSKEWQKELLPQGTKGTPDLKKASMDIGCRFFPNHSELIAKHGDADGILIAEYCRRTHS